MSGALGYYTSRSRASDRLETKADLSIHTLREAIPSFLWNCHCQGFVPQKICKYAASG